MPAFCFPNSDALRLALASGIVPPEAARESVRAGVDTHGRPWVEVPPGFPKDAAAALGRIGVTLHGPGVGPPLATASRWAEYVPLRAVADDRPVDRVLIELPIDQLARFVAELRRISQQPLAVRLRPEVARAWLLLAAPPLSVLLAVDVEAFVEQSPRVWVRAGWQHPLKDGHIAAPPGSILLLRPDRGWERVVEEPFLREHDTFAIPGLKSGSASATVPREAVAFPVPLTLRPAARPGEEESLWLLTGDPGERLTALARDTDERVVRTLTVAVVRAGGTTLTLVRAAGRPPLPALAAGGRGYVPHPELPGLHVPAGFALAPAIRPVVLARLCGIGDGVVTWVEAAAGGVAVHRVATAAFHPVAEWVRYEAPPATPLAASVHSNEASALPKFQWASDPEPQQHAVVAPAAPVAARPAAPQPGQSGIMSLIGTLFRGKSGPQRGSTKRRVPSPSPSPEPVGRVGDKLASPQALLLGNEWSARRVGLEQRVLADLPRLPPADRARTWSELAEVYAAVGHPGDSAVCWLSALWDADRPPDGWTANWLRAEAKAARVPGEGFDPDRVLGVPPSAATARVAAAYLTWAAGQSQPPADLPARVPHLLALLDAHESELPARALWLARLAASRLSEGDALGLARCRDRVFRRLTDRGPGLDLDAPAFLRFHGTADGDRSQAARDWLARARDPVHKWLDRLKTVSRGRLQWAGIDPEVPCTKAYSDLVLAWGLSKLGDRVRARDLEAAAGEVLGRAGGDGVDPTVHLILRLAFEDRIRAARDGRADRPGLPLEAAAELPRLDDLGRYAVDKLRSHCGVLEPVDLVNPYRGRELGGFLGTDVLGERLGRLLARPDLAPDPGEVRALLGIAFADPTAATLPRVAFALLEVSPRLEPGAAADVVGLTAAAVELLPEWRRVSGPADGEVATAVSHYGARALTGAAQAAGRFHLAAPFARLADSVRAAAVEAPGGPLVQAVERTAGRFFRTLRRLGLTRPAADLLAAFGESAAAGPRELGMAVGAFAVGDEDAGNRVLDAARDRLLVAGVSDARERTAVALAYATALGHSPPRVALGRLEELFLRLDALAVPGAANRYYTLRPLELIDTVVRAVVSEDFVLGPGVRGWLDDDEYLIRRRIGRDLEAVLAGVA